MDEENKSIEFTADDGSVVSFSVISETRFHENNYVLVCEPDGEEAFILKEIRDENDDIVYEMVDDDTEIDAVGEIFRAVLEDIDLV